METFIRVMRWAEVNGLEILLGVCSIVIIVGVFYTLLIHFSEGGDL